MRILARISTATFVIACVVHLASYFPAAKVLLVLGLPLPLAIPILFMLTISNYSLKPRPKDPTAQGVLDRWQDTMRQERRFRERAIRFVPVWVQLCFCLAFVYAFVSFFINTATDAETNTQRAIRMASAYAMVFALIPMVYFRWVEPGLASIQSNDEKPHSNAMGR